MNLNKFTVHSRHLYNQTFIMFGFVGLFGESKTSKKGGINYVTDSSTVLDVH
jgi:hypothetical protein